MILRLLMEVCLSTQFGHIGDGYGGRTPTIYYDRPVSAEDLGIAHRDFPIGSTVRVTNIRTGISQEVLVIDRGPYGKLDSNGKWFNGQKERNREGTYRGCADLTPRLARILRHNGKDTVRIIWIKDGRKRHELKHRRHRREGVPKRRKQRVPLKRRRNT